jgi:thiol-disulfide isomerase/thioredoxin
MRLKFIVFTSILGILFSCNKNNQEIEIKLNSNNVSGTINVSELITKKRIIQLSKDSLIKKIQLKDPIVAGIYLKERTYLTILEPNKNLSISIRPDSSLTTNKKSDSVLNYLWKSHNKFISKNSSFIFNTKNTDSIRIIFENLKKKRESEINTYAFSSQVSEILHLQSDTYIYSFLFYFGRIIKELDPSDRYFNFIKNIPEPNETLKSLPDIYLYKYEIEYLRKYKTLDNIPLFLRFIESKTQKKELSDYLKANYIKYLIIRPSYWAKHEKLFNTEVLAKVLKSEKDNMYSFLFKEPSSSFYKSQNGEIAYNFSAIDTLDKPFQLEDLKGKVVFIDVWATWCGPCLNHRPRVLELAEKYKNNANVKILLVSVDNSKDKWLSFLKKENSSNGMNLFIKNGMSTSFGNNYNVNLIPKYILIGKDGKIINSNQSEPSIAAERGIKKALREK